MGKLDTYFWVALQVEGYIRVIDSNNAKYPWIDLGPGWAFAALYVSVANAGLPMTFFSTD